MDLLKFLLIMLNFTLLVLASEALTCIFSALIGESQLQTTKFDYVSSGSCLICTAAGLVS